MNGRAALDGPYQSLPPPEASWCRNDRAARPELEGVNWAWPLGRARAMVVALAIGRCSADPADPPA